MRPTSKKIEQATPDTEDVDLGPIFSELQDLAWVALYSNKVAEEAVVFCIEICNQWSDFATQIATPSILLRTKPTLSKNNKFLLGVGLKSLSDHAAALAPELKPSAELCANPGQAKVIVYYSNGIMILNIKPTSNLQPC